MPNSSDIKDPIPIQSSPQFEDSQQPPQHLSPILEHKVEDNGGLKENDMLLEIGPNVEKSDNVVLRKLLRGPRYFDPQDNNWGNCSNCGEAGHTVAKCTAAKRKKPCFVCGSLDHNAKKCRQGKGCYICKKSGHRAKNCPEKSIAGLQNAKLCLKCGDSGHEMFTCNSAYSLDDLKEVQCYICKDFGHLCCVDYGEGPSEVSCYRCGQLGHIGLECTSTGAKANARAHVETTNTASPRSCYKCGGEGHKARKCKTSAKKRKRNTAKDDHLKGYNDYVGVKSAPHELGEARKRNKRQHGHSPSPQPKRRGGWINEETVHYNIGTQWGPPSTQRGDSASSQPMSRGGWINEHLGDRYNGAHWGPPTQNGYSTSSQQNHRGGWIDKDLDNHYNTAEWGSPSTPARYRSYNSFHENHSASSYGSGFHYEASSSNGYQHKSSSSRFGNSSNHRRGEYDWDY
uniref:uncharacterized protein LOC122600010 n=1 Tax=Erigeron canadensis TaxID=72917 RepID=UPI001CB8E297|nr:uncharacterized protein LOC122600010 [Erigeron canadensis]